MRTIDDRNFTDALGRRAAATKTRPARVLDRFCGQVVSSQTKQSSGLGMGRSAARRDTSSKQVNGENVATGLDEVILDLAPTGVLRASINLGNPVLAQGSSEEPSGVTVEIAREVARRLGIDVQFLTFDAARKSFDAMVRGDADLCFLAIDPVRESEVVFTAPYVAIEGVFVVPEGSAMTSADEVDACGVRIGVKEGSAYDLHLSRTIKRAEIMRGAEGVDVYIEGNLEVGAGIRQPVEAFVGRMAGQRIVEPAFMQIRQAVGVPVSRSVQSVAFLRETIDQLRTSGFIADSLTASGQSPALVAGES